MSCFLRNGKDQKYLNVVINQVKIRPIQRVPIPIIKPKPIFANLAKISADDDSYKKIAEFLWPFKM